MLKEFKEFAVQGNVLDMAIGIVIGSAFGSIVSSIVNDIIMPPIGLLLSGVDFSNLFIVLKEGTTPKPYASLALAQEAGAVTLNIGLFINTFISFLIIAVAIFLIVKNINRVRRKEYEQVEVAALKECPYCMTEIPLKAVRCPNCTSKI